MLHAAYSQQETPIGSRNMLGQKVQRDLAFDGIRSLLAAMTFLLRAAEVHAPILVLVRRF